MSSSAQDSISRNGYQHQISELKQYKAGTAKVPALCVVLVEKRNQGAFAVFFSTPCCSSQFSSSARLPCESITNMSLDKMARVIYNYTRHDLIIIINHHLQVNTNHVLYV